MIYKSIPVSDMFSLLFENTSIWSISNMKYYLKILLLNFKCHEILIKYVDELVINTLYVIYQQYHFIEIIKFINMCLESSSIIKYIYRE